jgi:hypothetical protein
MQTVPEAVFPELKCPLGEPLGPPKQVAGTAWGDSCEFAHAMIAAGLSRKCNRNVGYVAQLLSTQSHGSCNQYRLITDKNNCVYELYSAATQSTACARTLL